MSGEAWTCSWGRPLRPTALGHNSLSATVWAPAWPRQRLIAGGRWVQSGAHFDVVAWPRLESIDPADVRAAPVADVQGLAFNRIVGVAVERLRSEYRDVPDPRGPLEEPFTLLELQRLQEAVFAATCPRTRSWGRAAEAVGDRPQPGRRVGEPMSCSTARRTDLGGLVAVAGSVLFGGGNGPSTEGK